jgi:cell division protein FtsN
MAARKKSRQAVRNGGVPAWLWILIGLVGGALLMVWVMRGGYLPIGRQHDGPSANPQATAPRASAPGVADQASHKSGKAHKPNYDFYSMLPEKEVVIPDAEISKQAKAEAKTGATTAAPTQAGAYLLQVGSFPNASDAEAMKAKLALQGFVAEVKPVSINGKTWNRVRIGPFASAAKLEQVKQRLASAGIHAIALKAND